MCGLVGAAHDNSNDDDDNTRDDFPSKRGTIKKK